MKVSLLSRDVDLERIASEWNLLARGVPMRSWEWMFSWWKRFEPSRELYVLAVHDSSGTLVGAGPFVLTASAAKGRTIGFLGAGRACSDYLSILSTDEHEDCVAASLAEWLSAAARGEMGPAARWDVLDLEGVASTDRAIAKLVEQLVEHGSIVHRRENLNCWRIELPETWDDYLATLSKSHRKNLRRIESRVLDAGRARLRTASTPDEFPTAMETLIDLHQRRRVSLGEPGCFADPQLGGFIRDAGRRLVEAGQLELQVLELDGRPVAADYDLVGGDVVYAYQAGIDPDCIDEEPGRIMNIALLKRAIEHGRRAFDFLRGDEPYKAHWRAEPRPLARLRVVPDHTAARMRYGVWLAGHTVKRLMRSSLNLAGMH